MPPQDRANRLSHQDPPPAEGQQDRDPAKACLTLLRREVDRGPNQALPHVETAVRFNQVEEEEKEIIATKVRGVVRWFNVKGGYGFINRNDTKEDVFVRQTGIANNNPEKAERLVGDGEAVEFNVVVGKKGHEASHVTGPEGAYVKGSPHASDSKGREEEEIEERQSLREKDRGDDENRIHNSLEAPQGRKLEAVNEPPGGASMAAGTFKATRSGGTSLDTVRARGRSRQSSPRARTDHELKPRGTRASSSGNLQRQGQPNSGGPPPPSPQP